MAKQTVNIGSAANDGTGDPLRTAFDKLNDNFDEVYGDNFVTNARIADDAIDHDELAARYTASSAVTSATAITLDTATADVFTWTAGHSTTVAFTNVKVGSTCALVVTEVVLATH